MFPRCPRWRATWLPLLTLAAVSSGSVGCIGAYYSYAPLTTPPHPLTSRAPADVQVTVLKPPSQDFEPLGMLQVSPGTMQTLTSLQLIGMLRTCAARVGCEGLYVTDIEPWGSRYRSPYVRGACIIYPSSAPSPASSPPASSALAPAPAAVARTVATLNKCSPQMTQPRVPVTHPRVTMPSGGGATTRDDPMCALGCGRLTSMPVKAPLEP